ncbi:MAG: hypothetical protein PHQ52_02300 [Candidatus Omnitrophica bacterium]|nr:hypothetical protein [Candidatus Omnitrophota bacterium]
MRKYVQPKIKAIELYASSAILQVCEIGGVYMTGPSTPYPFCRALGTSNLGTCNGPIKGQSTGFTGNPPGTNAPADSSPS